MRPHVTLPSYLKVRRALKAIMRSHLGAAGSGAVWFARFWPSGSSLPLQFPRLWGLFVQGLKLTRLGHYGTNAATNTPWRR